MSFILDALKKSETERQQQGSAEFASVPRGSGSTSMPPWLWIVGLLLVINLVVLIGLFAKPYLLPDGKPTVAVDTQAVTKPAPAAAAAPGFEERVAAAQQNRPQQQQQTPELPSVEATATEVRPVLISQNPSAVPANSLYPTLQEVRAGGASDLPELHLDIHVYSSVPRERFVFINMVKHREGSQLAEGPVVAEITAEGVVLGHQGSYFLLPRE